MYLDNNLPSRDQPSELEQKVQQNETTHDFHPVPSSGSVGPYLPPVGATGNSPAFPINPPTSPFFPFPYFPPTGYGNSHIQNPPIQKSETPKVELNEYQKLSQRFLESSNYNFPNTSNYIPVADQTKPLELNEYQKLSLNFLASSTYGQFIKNNQSNNEIIFTIPQEKLDRTDYHSPEVQQPIKIYYQKISEDMLKTTYPYANTPRSNNP